MCMYVVGGRERSLSAVKAMENLAVRIIVSFKRKTYPHAVASPAISLGVCSNAADGSWQVDRDQTLNRSMKELYYRLETRSMFIKYEDVHTYVLQVL